MTLPTTTPVQQDNIPNTTFQRQNAKPSTPMRWVKRLGVFFLVLIVALILGLLIFQNVSDGPYGMLQGGTFRSGELMDASAANYEDMVDEPTELLLVGPGSSRTLGYLMHDGKVYISCDLGFMWNRFQGTQKHILNLIYIFKTWHFDAIEDGHAELRIAGKRYPGYLHLVEDKVLDAALKTQLEDLARQWIAPQVLGPVPDEPNEILFFKFEPGSAS